MSTKPLRLHTLRTVTGRPHGWPDQISVRSGSTFEGDQVRLRMSGATEILVRNGQSVGWLPLSPNEYAWLDFHGYTEQAMASGVAPVQAPDRRGLDIMAAICSYESAPPEEQREAWVRALSWLLIELPTDAIYRAIVQAGDLEQRLVRGTADKAKDEAYDEIRDRILTLRTAIDKAGDDAVARILDRHMVNLDRVAGAKAALSEALELIPPTTPF